MGNKYNSDVRTLLARNLVWQNTAGDIPAGAAPTGLKLLSAPSNLLFETEDLQEQPFRGNFGNIADGQPSAWFVSSNIKVKNVGVFSNFADGLVFNNINRRLALQIRHYTFKLSAINSGDNAQDVDLTEGSTVVGGIALNNLETIGYPTFLCDNLYPDYGNLYRLYDINQAGTTARLGDYSFVSWNNFPSIKKVIISSIVTLPLIYFTTLNTLYAQEYLIPTDVTHEPTLGPSLTAESDSFNFLTAQLVVVPEGDFEFYTPIIDTSFNDLPVTFDAVIELEVTPRNLISAPIVT